MCQDRDNVKNFSKFLDLIYLYIINKMKGMMLPKCNKSGVFGSGGEARKFN